VVERREGEPLNLKQLWHAALGELQLGLTKANYDTWFKDTAIVSEEDDVYCVGVPNAFAREWLENKYRQQVRDALRHLVGRTVDVRFVTLTAASVRSDRPVAALGGAVAGHRPLRRRRRRRSAAMRPRPLC
jgi:chromosomal replication initiator protein